MSSNTVAGNQPVKFDGKQSWCIKQSSFVATISLQRYRYDEGASAAHRCYKARAVPPACDIHMFLPVLSYVRPHLAGACKHFECLGAPDWPANFPDLRPSTTGSVTMSQNVQELMSSSGFGKRGLWLPPSAIFGVSAGVRHSSLRSWGLWIQTALHMKVGHCVGCRGRAMMPSEHCQGTLEQITRSHNCSNRALWWAISSFVHMQARPRKGKSLQGKPVYSICSLCRLLLAISEHHVLEEAARRAGVDSYKGITCEVVV